MSVDIINNELKVYDLVAYTTPGSNKKLTAGMVLKLTPKGATCANLKTGRKTSRTSEQLVKIMSMPPGYDKDKLIKEMSS